MNNNENINNKNQDTRSKVVRKKRKKRKPVSSIFSWFFKIIGILILLAIMAGFIMAGSIAGTIVSVLKDTPSMDPTTINLSLDQTSTIFDQNGQMIEKIQAPELRTFVSIENIPQRLIDAFISIEDERFYSHIGVDPRGVASSIIDNVKARSIVRGASTITQQLVKNVYLSSERKLDRKIKEAYMSLQLEKILTKDQILEAYLNRINLGQNAYGVQEAAQTYFSKDVSELTIAESALFAGICNSPTNYAAFYKIKPEDFDSSTMYEIGRVELLGEKYIAVYNPKSVERQKLVLSKMYELGKITYDEYISALSEEIKTTLKPGIRKIETINSFFADHVKTQVTEAFMNKFNLSRDEAFQLMVTGGYNIYATIDIEMQKKVEHVYSNFTEILVGNPDKIKGPILIDWKLNKFGNVIDEKGNIIYFKKENLLNDKFELIIESGSYELSDSGLTIKNNKLTPYAKHVEIGDYYVIDGKKNLASYTVGSFSIPEDQYTKRDDNSVFISSGFLKNSNDFYRIDEGGNLLISDNYFFHSKDGVVQPQSACVIMDHKTGHVLSLVGGRDVSGNRILNRATSSRRQPGSAIKPISSYLTALSEGYTAATAIDDTPIYSDGKVWPKNWYSGYKGIVTLRHALEQSINTVSVKLAKEVSVAACMRTLEKLHIINSENPLNDSFVTAKENQVTNDENLSALALGGMTKGVTPLELTAAYGAIANDGIFVKPVLFTKVVDSGGNIVFENVPEENIVSSPQTNYILRDIMRTTVYNGSLKQAQISNAVVAGKTGTTEHQADVWFVGFTPYYVAGVWIGNDAPKLTLNSSSPVATKLWQHIMNKLHENKEPIWSFNKPENIVTAPVCKQSGMKPTPLCSQDPRGSMVINEIFVAGTEPTLPCDVHVLVSVDETTNMIANEYCPADEVVEKVMIKRNPPFIPSEFGGIKPNDFIYAVPEKVCDIHNENTFFEPNPYNYDNYEDNYENNYEDNSEDDYYPEETDNYNFDSDTENSD